MPKPPVSWCRSLKDHTADPDAIYARSNKIHSWLICVSAAKVLGFYLYHNQSPSSSRIVLFIDKLIIPIDKPKNYYCLLLSLVYHENRILLVFINILRS